VRRHYTYGSAPASIVRKIEGERRAMKQPLIEGMALACERAIDR
jgi:hypothetical protein